MLRLLPCSHSLCEPCLLKLSAASRLQCHRRPWTCCIFCPSCHVNVELPCLSYTGILNTLPVNYSVKVEAEQCSAAEENSNHRLVCKSGFELLEEVNLLSLEDSRQKRTMIVDQKPLQEAMAAQEQPSNFGKETTQTEAHTSSSPSARLTNGPRNTFQRGDSELSEEEMEKSLQGLSFRLDLSTVPPSLQISPSGLTLTHIDNTEPTSTSRRHQKSTELKASGSAELSSCTLWVLADISIAKGLCYWEVDVYNSVSYRIGVCTKDRQHSWWLQREGIHFVALYDGDKEEIKSIPPCMKTLGVCLNHTGGTLSFHNTLEQEHLVTLPTNFGAAVTPAIALCHGKLIIHCGIPVPDYIFTDCQSPYREVQGAGKRWRKDVPFQPVISLIQRFEELATIDSDCAFGS
ncbi:uncharacterized protein LOC120536671 isoform X1 [Polypterus senegalus]|uniref:uncharacterized protein LOC120536671 isoform X1 n=2 Tax=Polypterus senegalus TaxID=55291 RepID=UPI0019664B4A|nr:uncharacterized protein LOC120536671 isoform X1 [Polypterus senegalus]